MRILYLHQYFTTPEQGGGTRSYEFARRWVSAGHEVHVLRIGSPAHGDDGGWRLDVIEGIHVHSLALQYSNAMGFYRRLGAFGGYAVAAAMRARGVHADAIYATSTPLTVAVPAIVASTLNHVPFVFEVRDLWPDVPIALGYLRNPLLRGAASWLERTTYRRAAHVVALAPGMRDDIVAKGVPESKVSVIPQGCDTGVFRAADPGRARASISQIGDGPLFVYAGAIGQANGLSYLIELADATRSLRPTARFVVLGEGKERPALEELARARGLLGHVVFFLGSQDKHEVADWMAAATATLAFLAGPRVLWKDAVQNKFFDSLAAERPIATNNDGWQTHIAVEEGVGAMLSPDDPGLGATQLLAMVDDREFMDAVPQNCRRLAATTFNREAQAAQALEAVELAVKQSGRVG